MGGSSILGATSSKIVYVIRKFVESKTWTSIGRNGAGRGGAGGAGHFRALLTFVVVQRPGILDSC